MSADRKLTLKIPDSFPECRSCFEINIIAAVAVQNAANKMAAENYTQGTVSVECQCHNLAKGLVQPVTTTELGGSGYYRSYDPQKPIPCPGWEALRRSNSNRTSL